MARNRAMEHTLPGETVKLLYDGDIGIRAVQRISAARADRWHGDMNHWTVLEWAGAMCGEAGEAANAAKKLRRLEQTLPGNAQSERPLALVASDLRDASEELQVARVALGRECADTFLYLVLLAQRYEIDLVDAVRAAFNAKSVAMGFPERI
jgi:NTP pyrophosphatase (non-canonical NTP hydrolase)